MLKLAEVCQLSQSSLVLVDNKNLVSHLQHLLKNQWPRYLFKHCQPFSGLTALPVWGLGIPVCDILS